MDINQVSLLIQQYHPEICISSIEPLKHGWYNWVFLVNKTFVFRFPKTNSYYVDKEKEVLEIIQNAFSFQVPTLLLSSIKSPFLALTYIQGFSPQLHEFNTWTKEEKQQTAVKLAYFLSEIHGFCSKKNCAILPIEQYNYKKEIIDIQTELNILKTWEHVSEATKKYVEEQAKISIKFFTSQLEKPCKTFIHNDIHLGNLIFSTAGSITGIIDFDAIKYGHPMLDFAVIGSTMGWEVLTKTTEEYNNITKQAIQPHIAWAINVDYLVSLIIKSVKKGETAMVPTYLNWLNMVRPEKI